MQTEHIFFANPSFDSFAVLLGEMGLPNQVHAPIVAMRSRPEPVARARTLERRRRRHNRFAARA